MGENHNFIIVNNRQMFGITNIKQTKTLGKEINPNEIYHLRHTCKLMA